MKKNRQGSVTINTSYGQLTGWFTVHGEHVPAKMYMKNGDPGYPAEYPDFEFYDVEYESGTHNKVRAIDVEKLSDYYLDKLTEAIE